MRIKNKILRYGLCFIFAISTVSSILQGPVAHAAGQIIERKLTLEAGATDGGSKAGGVVNHAFSFKVPTGGSVGSILFEYCTVAVGDCTTPPTGLVTTSATLDATQTGASGFSLVNTTNGKPYLTRTASSIDANTTLGYKLVTVTNPTAVNTSFFVRISTFTETDPLTGTPTAIDYGVVTASTATQIILTGIMPESLIFCTGGTIGTTLDGIPDCTTATTGAISFDKLFSPVDTATATSQMAASTNAINGYAINVYGDTLTSGSNTITAIGATADTSKIGHGQFGMNLMANTTATTDPAVGTAVAPAANGTNFRGQAAANYNTADSFSFVSGATGANIANSNNGGAGPTDSQIYTTTYIVNVSGSQVAGTYTTTLTYICTPTF